MLRLSLFFFHSVFVPNCVGLVGWFGNGPASWSVFLTQPEANMGGSQQGAKEVESGMARLFVLVSQCNCTLLAGGIGHDESGRDWLEENMVYGFIRRSTGSIKIPLLIGLLDHCIVRIRTSSGGRILWQHPDYHHGDLEIQQRSEPVTTPHGRILAVTVIRDGQEHAAFESVEQARRWAVKLGVVAPIAG